MRMIGVIVMLVIRMRVSRLGCMNRSNAVAVAAMASRLKKADQNGEAQSRRQGGRKSDAIVGVELELGEDIAGGDAKECAGGKRQRAAEEGGVFFSGRLESREKERRADGNQQSERSIDPMQGSL